MKQMKELKKYGIVLVLVCLMLGFTIASPYFFTVINLTNIVTQNTYFLIAAVGMSFVMIGGGIDFSVGYIMSLVGVVTAILMVNLHVPVALAMTAGLALGTILGMLNGIIISSIKVFPLIITLATSMVFQGISYLVSGAQTIRGYPDSFLFLTNGRIAGIPFDILLTIAVLVLAAFVYQKTWYGNHVMAMGGNEDASHLAGIKVRLIRISVYSLCGFFMALATMVMISKSNTTSSTFGPGTEFTCLTAAILGGISFKGGEGSIWGLVVGVFILAVLGNGMQLAGLGTYVQYIVKGLILLGAVIFDELQKQGRVKPARAA